MPLRRFCLSSPKLDYMRVTRWMSYKKHELPALREHMKSPRFLSSSCVLCAQCCWCLWLDNIIRASERSDFNQTVDNPFWIFSEIYLQTPTLIFCKVSFDSFFFFTKAIFINVNPEYISDCKTNSTKYIINIILRQILNRNHISIPFKAS